MSFNQFDIYFSQYIEPIAKEIKNNNSKIEYRYEIRNYKKILYESYTYLNKSYKKQIFNTEDVVLLDRHKVSSCLCGAVLKNPIFKLNFNKDDRQKYKAFFFYPNELFALQVSLECMKTYMISDYTSDLDAKRKILYEFPYFPDKHCDKVDFLTCIIFDLSEINTNCQIDKYYFDKGAYAIIFYFLEDYFIKTCLSSISTNVS